MKWFTFMCFFVCLVTIATAQERAVVWYFGQQAGIDFSQGFPVALSQSAMTAEAGCATMCSTTGDLLFYTNGNRIWNRDHEQMPRGDSLQGGLLLNQNSVIVPLPGSDSLYYLFTVSDSDTVHQCSYSIVDVSLDGGSGDVSQKNVVVQINVLEKIAAALHCNGLDFWVLVHDKLTGFYAYLLTDQGLVAPPVVSLVGTQPQADIGYLKISPASDRLALPVNKDGLLAEVFNFNNHSGLVSDPVKIEAKSDNVYCYGLEFSPNGRYLYMSTGGRNYEVWQYDLTQTDEVVFNQSARLISSGNNFAMQLAIDGGIYIASENRPYVNAILHPEKEGEACSYQSQALTFNQGYSLMGMPNIVQTWLYKPNFSFTPACTGQPTVFSFYIPRQADSAVMVFGDGQQVAFSGANTHQISHQYAASGLYTASLTVHACDRSQLFSDQIAVFETPVGLLPADTGICSGCQVVLDPGEGFDSYVWNDGSDFRFFTAYEPGDYTVQIEKNGCIAADSTRVWLIEPVMLFPNAFTPDGDGLNDVFIAVSNLQPVDFTLWVSNRGGTIVYKSKNYTEGWNGTFQGRNCTVGTYLWYARFSYYDQSGQLVTLNRKGFVTLLR